ncbi:MAG: MAPEG family protein [Deltaproteobacteria bacterium]|nr:MAPEG family protein [Nannocystaceae bacterium]
MTTPFVCILLAWLLAYAPKLVSSVAMARQPGGYDNKNPRVQQAKLEGWGARAHAAHMNGMENFPAFGIAVLVAHVGGGDPRRAGLLAISYVIARVLYTAAYVADVDRLRSVLWTLGLMATGALLVLPAL